MRHALTLLLVLIAVARGEKPAAVISREVAQHQARYAKIAPMLGRIMVADAKYSGGLPVFLAIEREYSAVRLLGEPVRAEFFFIVTSKI